MDGGRKGKKRIKPSEVVLFYARALTGGYVTMYAAD
jgi:hypothetical protein